MKQSYFDLLPPVSAPRSLKYSSISLSPIFSFFSNSLAGFIDRIRSSPNIKTGLTKSMSSRGTSSTCKCSFELPDDVNIKNAPLPATSNDTLELFGAYSCLASSSRSPAKGESSRTGVRRARLGAASISLRI